MKKWLIYIGFLTLFSCTNAQVELVAASSTTSVSLLQISEGTVSKIQTPHLSLLGYYDDILVSNLAIYNKDGCSDDAFKLGVIPNAVGAIMQSGLMLSEGSHFFYYKPIYSNAALNLTALCRPVGVNYIVDLTAPQALQLSLISAALTADRNVSINVIGCENTTLGSSSLIFKENSMTEPSPLDSEWQSCSANKIFSVSAILGNKYISVYAKDLAGNISPVSSPVGLILTTVPNIIRANTNPIYETTLTQIQFSNSGGLISSCAVSPALPTGLTLTLNNSNPANCQIDGTPTTVQPLKQYTVTAKGAGNSSVVIDIEVRPLPKALIDFTNSAGPGVLSSAVTGGAGETFITMLNAAVSSTNGAVSSTSIISYKYFYSTSLASTSLTDCNSPGPTYSTESSLGSKMKIDLALKDNFFIKLCVLAKNSDNIWQKVASEFTWKIYPSLQKLVDDFSSTTIPSIVMIDQPAGFDAVSRSFIVGGMSNVDITCDANCTFDVDTDGVWRSVQTVLPTNQVRFKSLAGVSNSVTTSVFSVSGVSSSKTYNFIVKSLTSADCSFDDKKIFLTRSAFTGNLNGTTGADVICNTEAANNSLATTGWKAFVSSTSNEALTQLTSNTHMRFCDAKTNKIILTSPGSGLPYAFSQSFLNFVNTQRSNGGDDSEWKFMPNVPRYQSATQFWYGEAGSNNYNCNNWTSESASLIATGGRLSFESRDNNPLLHLPVSGQPANGTSKVTLDCSKPQHLVCYQP